MKDGQRIDDFNAEKLAPTKLFYPRSWLVAVGYLDEEHLSPPLEQAAAGAPLPSAAGAWAVLSHLLVAALSVFATIAYTRRLKGSLGAGGSSLVADAPVVSVEMRRYQYQPVV